MRDIDDFRVTLESGVGLMEYLQDYAFHDEERKIQRIYLVRDIVTDELVVADFNSNRTAGRNDAITCFVSNLRKRHPDWSEKQIQDEVDYFFTEKEPTKS